MWTVATRATLLTAGFLVCAGSAARADVVEVKVPFPFVVHGRTLPAGEYRVEHDAADASLLVIRGEHGTKADTMTLTIPAGKPDPLAGKPALAFKHDENGYRLIDVWESNDQGQEVPGS
jgi:hypothetical protein